MRTNIEIDDEVMREAQHLLGVGTKKEAVDMALRPTDLLIFGAAKGGTPLMQAVQTIGIDLPLKALVWQDESGTTFLSYNDPAYLTRRHGLGDGAKPVVDAMTGALKAMAGKATMP